MSVPSTRNFRCHNPGSSTRSSRAWDSKVMRQTGSEPVWLVSGASCWLPRNRMRETFTSGSVGRAPGNRCLYPDRAKVSRKPWNWEQSHEMGCCYPVGASRQDSSPTRLTPSQQVGSDLHVQPQQWAYGAGGSEAAGRVIEPRKAYYRGQQDIPREVEREKPTVWKNRKAAVPDTQWRVCGTPPGSKSGACRHRGNSGTWESHCVSWRHIRCRRAVRR